MKLVGIWSENLKKRSGNWKFIENREKWEREERKTENERNLERDRESTNKKKKLVRREKQFTCSGHPNGVKLKPNWKQHKPPIQKLNSFSIQSTKKEKLIKNHVQTI